MKKEPATEEERKKYYSRIYRVCLHQNEIGILCDLLEYEIDRYNKMSKTERGWYYDRYEAVFRLYRKLKKHNIVQGKCYKDLRNYVPYVKS